MLALLLTPASNHKYCLLSRFSKKLKKIAKLSAKNKTSNKTATLASAAILDREAKKLPWFSQFFLAKVNKVEHETSDYAKKYTSYATCK